MKNLFILLILLFFVITSCKKVEQQIVETEQQMEDDDTKYETSGTPNVKISGYLIDKCTGIPLDGVDINLIRPSLFGGGNKSVLSTVSDKNGYYEVAFQAHENYESTGGGGGGGDHHDKKENEQSQQNTLLPNSEYQISFTKNNYFFTGLHLMIYDSLRTDSIYTGLVYGGETDTNLEISQLSTLTINVVDSSKDVSKNVLLELNYYSYNFDGFTSSAYRNKANSDTSFVYVVQGCEDLVSLHYELYNSNVAYLDTTVFLLCPTGQSNKYTITY